MEKRQRRGLTHRSRNDTDVPAPPTGPATATPVRPDAGGGLGPSRVQVLPAVVVIFLSTGPRRARTVSSERGRKTTPKIPIFTRSLLLPCPYFLSTFSADFLFELFSIEDLNLGVFLCSNGGRPQDGAGN